MVDEADDSRPRVTRREEISAGIRIVMPASLAVVPLGLSLGVLIVQSGLAWWWGPVFAAVVFAGSLEFLLIGLVMATAPLAQVAVSALMVNFRHAFYALTFPLHQVKGWLWKAYSTFALTDEVYAVTTTPRARQWSHSRIIAIQVTFHLIWVLSVTIGSGLGGLIPPSVIGLDFAITALFVVLAMEAYRVRKSVPVPLLALACVIAGGLLTPQDMLLTSMVLFVAALLVTFLVSRLRRSHA